MLKNEVLTNEYGGIEEDNLQFFNSSRCCVLLNFQKYRKSPSQHAKYLSQRWATYLKTENCTESIGEFQAPSIPHQVSQEALSYSHNIHILKYISINYTMISTPELPSIVIKTTMGIDKDSDHSVASTTSMISLESSGSIDDFAGDDFAGDDFYSAKLIDNDRVKTKGPVTASVASVSTRTKKKRVRFGTLEVHEHVVQLGGSGVPSSGPSTTLEWEEHAYYFIKSVEFFEDSRPFENKRGAELAQTKSERMSMLLAAGYTMNEINVCMKENDEIRKQRLQSIKKSQRFPLLSKVFRS